MLCADKVDTEVGMEVSVNKEFSPDLSDNSSKAYRDFTDTFRDQVRGKGRELKGLPLELSLGPWVPSGMDVQM